MIDETQALIARFDEFSETCTPAGRILCAEVLALLRAHQEARETPTQLRDDLNAALANWTLRREECAELKAQLAAQAADLQALKDELQDERETFTSLAEHHAATELAWNRDKAALQARDAAYTKLLTYVQHMAARELCEDDPKVEACYTESGPDCGAHGPPDPAVKEARRLVAALETAPPGGKT